MNVKGGLLERFKWPKKELDTAIFTPNKFWCLHIITEYYLVSSHYAT
jgi:hypothetical protein